MIRAYRIAFLSFIVMLGVGSPVPLAAAGHHSAKSTDWAQVVTATPDGFRMGNSKAKLAIVEYFSFTCPHCAAFAAEAVPKLEEGYVRSGKVSFEARLALRDRGDFVAAMTARCGGTRAFFPLYQAIFAAQASWIDKAIDYDNAHPSDLQGAGGADAIAAIAAGSGLDAIAKGKGVSAAALKRCYADTASRAVVERTTQDAWATRKIAGTPGFLLNDTLLDTVHSWADLEPKITNAFKS